MVKIINVSAWMLLLNTVLGFHQGEQFIRIQSPGSLPFYKSATVSPVSRFQCIIKCNQDQYCDRFDFKNEECTLGRGKFVSWQNTVVEYLDATELWLKVYKTECAEPKCVSRDMSYTGDNNFAVVYSVGSPDECACECTKTKGCTNWGYVGTECYLKHTLTDLEAYPNAQSGSLLC
ncbi:uncharacterized protein LOC111696496 [Eurytemora carolleeae]|uniref:uncharacterized protein LOC111696496 n=1 Tax=Eurytemora carolleeae TaxID=1294199 RepID=UPI000C762792|nr:uncharacterized protein LOC111696496 [Eurytemora carolleeae]|eukprot:XP_023321877.1 uncharacterized protein LOC111696496 [Eurytemora affinis]